MQSDDIRSRFNLLDIMLLLVAVFWGLNFIFVKVSLEEMDPLLYNTLRLMVGTIACWVILLVKEKEFAISKKQFWHFVLLGAVVHSVHQVTLVLGIAKTTAGASSILLASAPVFVAFTTSVLKLEQASKSTWIGIIISFAGVIFVVAAPGQVMGAGMDSLWGNLLMVAAAILWGIYTILLRVHFKEVSGIKVTAYALLFTTLPLIVLVLGRIPEADWASYSLKAWGGVFYSGIFVLGIANIIWNAGVQKVGPTKTSIYANLPPFISVLAGWLILKESVALTQILGGAFIIAGVLYANKSN